MEDLRNVASLIAAKDESAIDLNGDGNLDE